MNLNGNKNNVNVTLQLQVSGCLLTIDNSHKVFRVQYSDNTTLAKVKEDIERVTIELGYTPKKIVINKVKQFKFK